MKSALFYSLLAFVLNSCNTPETSSQTDSRKGAPSLDQLSMNQSLSSKKQEELSCKLTTLELQKRKATILSDLQKLIQEKKELKNGYTYRFKGSDDTIDLLTDFVKSERQCCDFFSFSINIKDAQTIWLDITGPEGAKDFIKTELEL